MQSAERESSSESSSDQELKIENTNRLFNYHKEQTESDQRELAKTFKKAEEIIKRDQKSFFTTTENQDKNQLNH